MRKHLIAKEKEAKLVPGQKVPSTTGRLRFFASADKHGSSGCFRELSRNFPTVSRNPGWTFTRQTSTTTVCSNQRLTIGHTVLDHLWVGTCKPPFFPDKLLVSALLGMQPALSR